MIELTIGKKTYTHPSKIEEVTLEQWVAIQAAEQGESATHIENNISQFSALTGIPVKKLETVNTKDLLHHINIVFEMIDSVPKMDGKPPKSFKVDGETYIVNQDIDLCPVSQYIECTHYMNLMNSSPEFYPYMMAIYCLKKGEKPLSTAKKLEARVKVMLKANVIDAIKVNTFFLHISQSYLKDSQLYLRAK